MPGNPGARKLKAIDVIDVLSDLFILRGVPGHIRSDNGPEFVAKAVQEWITAVGAKTAYITLGSPWENGYVESFKHAYAMNCSTAKSSTRCERLRSSSRVGGVTSTRSGRMHRSATSHQPPRCSCLRSPRGRLRYATSLAGHASTPAGLELTFHLDHPMGSITKGEQPIYQCIIRCERGHQFHAERARSLRVLISREGTERTRLCGLRHL